MPVQVLLLCLRIPQIGLAVGSVVGTGVFALLQVVVDDEGLLAHGWRIAFLVSIVLVAIVFVVRLEVDETRPSRRSTRSPRSRRRRCARSSHRPTHATGPRSARPPGGEGSAFNTPIRTALIGAGHGTPWIAAGHLVATGPISVVATKLIRPAGLHP